MKKIIRIRNLDCAACAAELSEELAAVAGVETAQADFVTQRVTLVYEGEAALEKCLYLISHFEEVELVGGAEKKESHLKEIVSIAVSAACFVPALVLLLVGDPLPAKILFYCAFAAAGWSVVWNVIRSFPRVFRGGFHPLVLLDENMLMTIAAIGAFAIGEDLEGAAVMLLYQIGELLQGLAVGASRGEIARLAALQTSAAIRIREGVQEEIPPEELCVGDVIFLRKGDKVPADCRIVEGETAFDTKSLTGESYLRETGAGDELLAGYVNAGNAVKAEVVRLADESAVAKILEMVENSSSQKARPEKFITKFARIYTPVVVLFALLIAVIPPLFQGYNFTKWLVPAIEFLVISCPCALIISVPLTYFSGVGSLARHGVLTKGAVYLDQLAKVRAAAFDKTGTLTEGKFAVISFSSDRALALAAALEKASSHPLAQAFAGIETAFVAESPEERAGMGLAATVEGKQVLVGSRRLMQEAGIAVPEEASVNSVVYVAEGGEYVGKIEIGDTIRPEAKEAIAGLRKVGVETVAVFTGDTKARAEATLKDLGVDLICADLLPAEKPREAEKLKDAGLMYVGDGINDTPVMAASAVSVAMGGLGSDAAIETADFVLAGDDLRNLPRAIKAAKKTRRIVFENIFFSVGVKVALMAASVLAAALGAFSLPIWAAVFGDVGVMLLAVLNSMRMRGKIKG